MGLLSAAVLLVACDDEHTSLQDSSSEVAVEDVTPIHAGSGIGMRPEPTARPTSLERPIVWTGEAPASPRVVRGPAGNTSIDRAAVAGGAVANASSPVAAMAPGFRRCYRDGLLENPTMSGSVRITAKIGPNGEVLSASPSRSEGLSDKVISCVAKRVSVAQFAPPEGGGTTIVIPVTFLPDESFHGEQSSGPPCSAQ
ncbi:MAG: AgmX/PglI C-terminal domain-containing protein [Polyangiaceae bacterium]